jgi:hypothetical protein
MGNIFFGIGERVTIWLPIFFYHNSAQSSPRLGFGRVVTPPDRFVERLQKCSERLDAKCSGGRRQISCNGTNK